MLQPGEIKEVSMDITTNDISFYNSNLDFCWEPGDFMVYVGANSQDAKGIAFNWEK
jgi:beta-glucosidase